MTNEGAPRPARAARILLVQPGAGERLSGGYLYNAQMAAHGAWELLSVSAADLPAALAAADPDLVIADSIWLQESTFDQFLRLPARGIRLGVMMHSFPSMISQAESGHGFRPRPTDFELEALTQAGLMVVPGPHYAEMVSDLPIRVAICQPGIDDAFRTPPRPRGGVCQLISLGAVTPRKGYRDVVEALRLVPPREPYRWSVVGSLEADRAYADGLAEAARALGGSVVLLGQKSPDQVRGLLAASDLLLMPSYDENHPLVVLEAIAASVPTVGYQAGAAAEMLGHGACGLVGPIGDRATLARNLARLIDDETHRRRLAEACWERQADLPGWAVAATRARQLLERDS